MSAPVPPETIIGWGHVISAIVGGSAVALFSSILNAFVLRPRFCVNQQERCKREIMEAMKEADRRANDSKAVAHQIFARKDVIEPQVDSLKYELAYVRKRLDQIATQKYNLPPVVITNEDIDNNGL